ncbi:hypothetical protein HF288_06310 [Acidithiobacillus caldus]|jgi:hypothetical protein|uniref:hypothetical protein n=1 Tax=Acidithiobacillus caldus TaxID=33059 RepID=UPI001C06636E|nr:hypothetical protein [Acidithiobacillus caldus]MBU2790049.1 hypothetical protein [Acidithiobacillus caldus]MBU2820932.1 hypothetical protein [Acidithiobacillus caldus]
MISVEQLEKKKAALEAAIVQAKQLEKRRVRVMKSLVRLGLLDVDEELLQLGLQELAEKLRENERPKTTTGHGQKEGRDEDHASTI